MLYSGCGGKGAEGGGGVTVTAAVAFLERRQEEQRRTAPSPVRRLQRCSDLNSGAEPRDSSESSASSIGETIARLKSRFGSSGGSCSASASEPLQDGDQKSMKKHAKSVGRNELASVRKREPDNSDVKTDHVATESEGNVSGIRKSPSTKNISSLVRNNSVLPPRNIATLSLSDSKTQDLRKCLGYGTPGGTSKVISPRSSPVPCDETLSEKQGSQSELSSKVPGDVRRSSSAEDVLDQHDDFDDDGLGATSLRTDPHIVVKQSTSDSNIPRKRPRVIHLRDSVTSSEVASQPDGDDTGNGELSAGPLQLRNSTAKIVLEYPPPPPSPPPECEDGSSCSLNGGSSPSDSGRIVASAESLGTYSLSCTVTASLHIKVVRNKTVTRNNCTIYLSCSYYNRDCFGLFIGHPQAILTILNINIKVTIPITDPLCTVKSNCIYYRQRFGLHSAS
jgi:hypothetical protein